jgi:hypothetical protein
LGADVADVGQQLVQELAGRPHERFSLQVLVAARRLTHEEEPGVRVSHAEDQLRARLAERAAMAIPDVLSQRAEVGAVGGTA